MTAINRRAGSGSYSASMPVTLFDRDGHRCLMFTDLGHVPGTDGHADEAVQSNQFLIVDGDTGAIIDPGGNLAFSELYLGMTRHFPPHRLTAILASHADPDIIASVSYTHLTLPTKRIV